MLFFGLHVDQGLSPQTIKSYLAAVHNMQISLGFPDPWDHSSIPILKRVQAGIRRVRMEKGTQSRIRLPITLEILGKIQQHLQSSRHPQCHLIWAISALAFFGFFRLGELLPDRATFDLAINLAWGDVAHLAPRMVQVHLRRSKSDQFGAGADVVVGQTDSELCPVQAVLDYVHKRGSSMGPFFIIGNGGVVTKSWFISQLCRWAVGLPQDQFAGHSFRIGAATAAAMAGVEDSTIQSLGRWPAFLQYIRTLKSHLASMSKVKEHGRS